MNPRADMRDVPVHDIIAGDRVRIGFGTFHVNGNTKLRTHHAIRLRKVRDGAVSEHEETRLFSHTSVIFRVMRSAACDATT